ncbi:MAG TPA: nitroreductase, partial [Methylomirabilota bacterium]|nr:nitroreductase [Methylomirabilota bacterium]
MDLKAVDELLTTTRSIRRRFDLTRPVPVAIIQQCLEIAIQAPTGGDT